MIDFRTYAGLNEATEDDGDDEFEIVSDALKPRPADRLKPSGLLGRFREKLSGKPEKPADPGELKFQKIDEVPSKEWQKFMLEEENDEFVQAAYEKLEKAMDRLTRLTSQDEDLRHSESRQTIIARQNLDKISDMIEEMESDHAKAKRKPFEELDNFERNLIVSFKRHNEEDKKAKSKESEKKRKLAERTRSKLVKSRSKETEPRTDELTSSDERPVFKAGYHTPPRVVLPDDDLDWMERR